MRDLSDNYQTKVTRALDYATLCRLVSEGKGDDDIAEMYYVSRSTIFRTRQQWGILKPKNPEKYNWEQVKRMLECNLTYADIAYIYQTTTKNITRYVSRKRNEEQSNDN